MTKFQTLRCIGKWLLFGFRVVTGILVAKTGIDLLEGEIIIGYNRKDTPIIGLFVLPLGVYFIFSSLTQVLFTKKHDI